MADSSFDIVSKLDRQEVDNALGQAAREVATRFDFKGTGATIEWKGEKAIEITASADDRATHLGHPRLAPPLARERAPFWGEPLFRTRG